MLTEITMKRDELIRRKKLMKDEPANYYDGVLDLWNEVKRILEAKDEDN